MDAYLSVLGLTQNDCCYLSYRRVKAIGGLTGEATNVSEDATLDESDEKFLVELRPTDCRFWGER
jgi:hypothetical protein